MPVFSTSALMSASACAYAAPLPRMMSGFFAPLSRSSARFTASGAGICFGAGIDDLDQRILARPRRRSICAKSLAGRSRYTPPGRPDTAARMARAMPTPMSSACSTRKAALATRLGDGELVHLLVVALLQVDDLALARAADEDHREAVDRGVRERVEAVQEARRRHRQADAGLLREEAGDRRGVARVLLVAEREHAQAGGLGAAREVGDRDAGQAEDRVDAVQLEGIDDELKAVDRVLRIGGRAAAATWGSTVPMSGLLARCDRRDRYGKNRPAGAGLD